MSTINERNDTYLAPRPLVTRPDLGRATWFGSNFITALATSEETGGRYALLRLQNQRSYSPPPQRHGSEAFHVVSGVLRFDVQGEGTILTDGSFLEMPPGAWHTFAVQSDEAEFHILTAPGWVSTSSSGRRGGRWRHWSGWRGVLARPTWPRSRR